MSVRARFALRAGWPIESHRVDRIDRSGSGRWFYAYVENMFDPLRVLVRGESWEDAYAQACGFGPLVREMEVTDWFADYVDNHPADATSEELARMAVESGALTMNESGDIIDTESLHMFGPVQVDWFASETNPPLRIFAALYGESNYSHPDKAEEFRSLAEVRDEWDRRANWPRQSRDGLGTPLWGEGLSDRLEVRERATCAFVWFLPMDAEAEEVATVHESYPSKLLTIGPRGGYRFEDA